MASIFALDNGEQRGRFNDQIPKHLESNRRPTADEASRLNRRLGGPTVGMHRFSALYD